MMSQERIAAALEIIYSYGQIEGDHHKTWVIDQVTRCLTGDQYDTWVAEYKTEDGDPEAYSYEIGIAP
jgi:hypothetical protein